MGKSDKKCVNKIIIHPIEYQHVVEILKIMIKVNGLVLLIEFHVLE